MQPKADKIWDKVNNNTLNKQEKFKKNDNRRKHVCAVINGVIHDTFDSSREGSRCVYGYWKFN